MGTWYPGGETSGPGCLSAGYHGHLLDLAGGKALTVQFNSFMDIIRGERQQSHYNNGVYGAYIDVQRMIRKDGFKLLVYPKILPLLFDMDKDPNEMNDLADSPAYREKVRTLFADLLELQKTMGDKLDLNGLYNKMYN
ncbi:MAG: DUF4976 domain-containing protein [Flavobacteriaceae bacterium]